MTPIWFPILGGPKVPFYFIEPHEAQAKKNHYQSLERLAERGGLSCAEFWLVMNDLEWESGWGKDYISNLTKQGKELAQSLLERHYSIESAIAERDRQAVAWVRTHKIKTCSRPFGKGFTQLTREAVDGETADGVILADALAAHLAQNGGGK